MPTATPMVAQRNTQLYNLRKLQLIITLCRRSLRHKSRTRGFKFQLILMPFTFPVSEPQKTDLSLHFRASYEPKPKIYHSPRSWEAVKTQWERYHLHLSWLDKLAKFWPNPISTYCSNDQDVPFSNCPKECWCWLDFLPMLLCEFEDDCSICCSLMSPCFHRGLNILTPLYPHLFISNTLFVSNIPSPKQPLLKTLCVIQASVVYPSRSHQQLACQSIKVVPVS